MLALLRRGSCNLHNSAGFASTRHARLCHGREGIREPQGPASEAAGFPTTSPASLISVGAATSFRAHH